MWKIVKQEKLGARENMLLDEKHLLEIQPDDEPILYFYEWKNPSATFGVFTKPKQLFKETQPLDLAVRPTGGGVLFHLWDLAFSAIVPAHHPGYSADIMKNYKFINDAVLEAVKNTLNRSVSASLLPVDPVPLDQHSAFFCFAKPTKYDVMIDGKKIAGAAQRRKKNGYLHQGSISISPPSYDFLERILLPEVRITEAMKLNTYYLLKSPSQSEFVDAKESLKNHLIKALQERN